MNPSNSIAEASCIASAMYILCLKMYDVALIIISRLSGIIINCSSLVRSLISPRNIVKTSLQSFRIPFFSYLLKTVATSPIFHIENPILSFPEYALS